MFTGAGSPATGGPAGAQQMGGGWSVAIPTPSIGKHTIYAASTQGFSTSAPTSVTFNVTK